MLRLPNIVAKSRLSLLSGCLLLSLNVFAKEEKSDQVYWQEAGMDLSLLLQPDFITRESCQQSFVIFQGCYEALNAVAAKAFPSLEVLPKSVLEIPTFKAGSRREDLSDDLTLTDKLPTEIKSLRLATQDSKHRRHLIDTELLKIFDKSIVAPIDFPALLEKQLKISNVPEDRVPMVVAQAMNAFVKEALDPHAHVEPAARIEDTLSSPNLEIVGVGTQLELLNEQIVVVRTIPESSAEKAGVLENDIIVAVNGKSVKGLAVPAVVKMIGSGGPLVKLDVNRSGNPREFNLPLGPVVVPKVSVTTREIFGSKYAVISLTKFTDRYACNQVEEQLLREIGLYPDIAGIILDERNNPGGLLQQAVCIGSLFVGQKLITKDKELGSSSSVEYIGSRRAITNLPVVTLIDAGSASASEVLAGALQDYKRSWIVGDRSFGKGTVQTKRRITSRIHLYRTTSRYYRPLGGTSQIVGIIPDFQAYEKPNPTEEEKFAVREGDVFDNALAPVGKAWEQKRVTEVRQINDCRARDKKAETAFAADPGVDYQMLVAAEVLGCDPVKSVALP